MCIRDRADTIDCGAGDGDRDVVRAGHNDTVIGCDAAQDVVRKHKAKGHGKKQGRAKRF